MQLRVSEHRKVLDDMASWYFACSIRARSGISLKQLQAHRAIGAGALWCDLFAFKSGFQQSPECSKCGARIGDIHHMFWQCPSTQ
eukprot:4521743-Alexandrium_andersonii.AAC.1